MKIRSYSFKLKLTFSYILVILVSFGLVAYFLDKNLEENSLQEIKSSLINQAHLIVSQVPQDAVRNENTPLLEGLVRTLSPKIKCRLTILNKQGKVLAD